MLEIGSSSVSGGKGNAGNCFAEECGDLSSLYLVDWRTEDYLNGYDSLKRFLVEILQWPDDENHTLPQMKSCRNFVLMVDEQKGLLLAKDVCEYIADTENPYYDQEEASQNAFRMLTEEMLCPPDLLHYCIEKNLLPDAELPEVGEKMLVKLNADFIARHSLLYYYRGD